MKNTFNQSNVFATSLLSFFLLLIISTTAIASAPPYILLDQDGEVYDLRNHFQGVVVIDADNVRFNMNGFILYSPDNKMHCGIEIKEGHEGIAIIGPGNGQNGKIMGFNTGIYSVRSFYCQVQGVEIYGCNWGILTDGAVHPIYSYVQDATYDGLCNANVGYLFPTGALNFISYNAGRFGIFDENGFLQAFYTNCTTILSGSDGFRIANHFQPVIASNVSSFNNGGSGIGLFNINSSTFTNCESYDNHAKGIKVEDGSNPSTGNFFDNCSFSGNLTGNISDPHVCPYYSDHAVPGYNVYYNH
jgi:hypothetical protein